MAGFEELTQARPDLLEALAQRWDRWADDLDRLGDQLGSQVLDILNDPSIWRGRAAFAAAGYVANLKLAVHRAADKMRDVPIALRTAERAIGEAQHSASEVVSHAAGAGLLVGPDGRITGSDGGPIPAEHEGLARDLAGQIERAVQKAADADLALMRALHQESADIADATEVSAEVARAEADAARAAELGALGSNLTVQQQNELANLLAANSNDATFSTALHERLGPDGAFQLYADLAGVQATGPQPPDPATIDRLARIQTELGESLATATDERNDDHVDDRWQNELEAAGERRYEVPGVPGYTPYGYQVLGGLLQSGDYQPDFLDRVGDSTLAFENGDSDVWVRNQPVGPWLTGFDLSLNDGDGPAGYDPVLDLYHALDDNPEAARRFLDPGDNPDRLRYLFNERDYLPLSIDNSLDPIQSIGYDALGGVLEAGTLDAPRDERSAAIVSEMVHVLGGPVDGTELSAGGGRGGDIPPPLRDNVANVLAGYIGDVNHAYSIGLTPDEIGWGGDEGPNHVGPNGFAAISQGDLSRLFNGIAADPNAYQTVHDANTVYATLQVHELGQEHAGSSPEVRADAINKPLGLSSNVFGALDGARIGVIEAEYGGNDDAYNQRLNNVGVLGSIGSGAVIAATIANPVAGAIVGGASSFVMSEVIASLRQDSSAALSRDVGAAVEGSYSHTQQLAIQATLDQQLYDSSRPPPDLPANVAEWDSDDLTAFDTWRTGVDDPGTPQPERNVSPMPVDIIGDSHRSTGDTRGDQGDY